MLPDRVSNPGLLTYESGALPIALRGPAFLSTRSADLLVLRSRVRAPPEPETLLIVNVIFIAHNLSLSSAHRPDMTEILLIGRKLVSHPSILLSFPGLDLLSV